MPCAPLPISSTTRFEETYSSEGAFPSYPSVSLASCPSCILPAPSRLATLTYAEPHSPFNGARPAGAATEKASVDEGVRKRGANVGDRHSASTNEGGDLNAPQEGGSPIHVST